MRYWLVSFALVFLVMVGLVLVHPGPLPGDVGVTRGVQNVLGTLSPPDAAGYVASVCVLLVDTEAHWPDVIDGLAFGGAWTFLALIVPAGWRRSQG